MCFTDFDIWYEVGQRIEKSMFKNKPQTFQYEFTLEEWIRRRGYVAPMTWVYRKDIMDSFQRFPYPDSSFMIFAHFLAVSKVKCLVDETTAVYRSLKESASHTNNPQKYYDRLKGLKETQEKLIRKYNLSNEILENVKRDYYISSYKIIGIMNDESELVLAYEYCRSFIQKLFLGMCNIQIFRKACLKIYKIRKS
jgi:hypothetical protein